MDRIERVPEVGIAQFRVALSNRIEVAYYRNEPTIITKAGQPRAVLVSYDWYVEHAAKDH